MHTVHLKISDKIYDKLMALLNDFSKDDLEVISESAYYNEAKEYLHGELQNIETGKAKFLSVEEAEERFEKIIKKHENPS